MKSKTRIMHRCDQRSADWYEARKGKFTASCFTDLMPAKSKAVDSWTEGQLKTIYATVAERMTTTQPVPYTSQAMQWGIDTEKLARQIYEIEKDCQVFEIGFIELDPWTGCSPDGLILSDGLTEIKCPNSDTHLMYRNIPGKLADTYFWQVQGQLWISDRKWCDLISFDPRFKKIEQQLFIVRVERDEDAIKRLEARIEAAIAIAETIEAA